MKKKPKIIKAYAVMNLDESNGHEGILWFPVRDQRIDSIALQIYATFNEAVEMASRGYHKVVPVEIHIKQ